MKMTYPIAMAAGRDAGDRNAKTNGRTRWNDEDYCVAAEVASRLMGLTD